MTCVLQPFQSDTLFAGVKVYQSVIVPKHAVALAGDEHRNGNLRVYLREPPRQSSHVAIAVLELSEPEEVFVLGRDKRQRSLARGLAGQRAGHQLMPCGCEHHLPFRVSHFHTSVLLVHLHGNPAVPHLAVLHVNPFRKRVGRLTLHIFDTYCVWRDGLHLKAAPLSPLLCLPRGKLPPVQVHVATRLAEAEIEVVDSLSPGNFRRKYPVKVHRTRVADGDIAQHRTVLAV